MQDPLHLFRCPAMASGRRYTTGKELVSSVMAMRRRKTPTNCRGGNRRGQKTPRDGEVGQQVVRRSAQGQARGSSP